MRFKSIISLFLIFVPIAVFSWTENASLGSRSAALGGASVSLSDLWSTQNNQAGLGGLKKPGGGFYFENRFLLKELSLKAATVVYPTKNAVFGFVVNSFGYDKYSENKFGLSFSRAFSELISVGLQLDYLNTQIADGYGKKGVIAGELGILSKPVKNLTVAAHLFNPSRAKLSDYSDERIPSILKFGLNYKFSDKIFVALESEKSSSAKASFKGGIEYHVVEMFYIRGGISTNPSLNCFGVGIRLKNFDLDLSASHHNLLGFSPQVGLSYTVK